MQKAADSSKGTRRQQEFVGVDDRVGGKKTRKVRIQSYQDFGKYYREKGVVSVRYPFIQVQNIVTIQGGIPTTCFVHELLSMDYESHTGLYDELKRYVMFQNETTGLMKIENCFVKVDDELERRKTELTNRYFFITTTEKFEPLSNITSPSFDQISKWFLRAFETLNFLHTHDFLFRNIHAGSLIIVDGEIKFTMPGFGFDHFIDFIEDEDEVVDPEIYAEGRFSTKSDVYSVAMVFLNLMSDGFGEVLEKYKKNNSEICQIIENCIEEKSSDRYSVVEVLKKLRKPKVAEVSIEDVKSSIDENMDNIISRGEQMQEIERQSETLKESALSFKKKARKQKARVVKHKKKEKKGGGGWFGGLFSKSAKSESRMKMDESAAVMDMVEDSEWMYKLDKKEEAISIKTVHGEVSKYEEKKIEDISEEDSDESLDSVHSSPDEDGKKKEEEKEKEERMEEPMEEIAMIGDEKKRESRVSKRKDKIVEEVEDGDDEIIEDMLEDEGLVEFDALAKIILVGSSGVGKSSIVSQYAHNKFNASYAASIGVDFATKTEGVDDKRVKNQVWDTAGQERFRTITSSYYRGAHVAIIVFDLTSRKSFEEAKNDWLNDLKSNADEDIIVFLVGNKSDRFEERQVSAEEVDKFCKKQGIEYFETSAKTGINVQNLFHSISRNYMDSLKMRHFYSAPEEKAIKLSRGAPKKGGGCGGGIEFPKWMKSIVSFFSESKEEDLVVLPPQEDPKPPRKPEQPIVINVKDISQPDEEITIEEDEKSIALLKSTEKIYNEPVVLEEEGLKKKKLYNTKRIIGSGGQSSCFLVEHNESKKTFVIKRYKPGVNENEYILEVKALKSFEHENIVRYEDSFQYTDNYGELNKFIVMEYCEKGDLSKFLRKMAKEEIVSNYFDFVTQLLLGLNEIHNTGFVHHDIKPSNIFIDKDLKIKIGDFGFCMKEGEIIAAKGGTVKYMSPEQKRGVFCKKFLDIWSLALVCIEIIVKRLHPRVLKDLGKLAEKLNSVDDNGTFKGIIRNCFNPKPVERPSCEDIIKKIKEILEDKEEIEGENEN